MKYGVAIQISWENVTDFEIKENIGKPIRVMLNNQVQGVWPSSDGNRIELHCNEGSFQSIHNFTFTENDIENPSDLLRCLTPTLESLILTGNFTEKLSSTLLEPFTNMWKLIIRGAQSMDIDLKSIKKLKHLSWLNVAGNHVKEVANASLLETFPPFFAFILNDNQIKNAAELIQHLPTSIPISSSPIQVPSKNLELFQISTGERVSMSALLLSGNHVGKLNATTFHDGDIYVLDLKNTSLSFDDVKPFESLKNLIHLDISYNDLANTDFSVPSTAFKNLTSLSATHCNITNASRVIDLLGSTIQYLDLSGNYVGQLNAAKFESFTRLQRLNLRATHLIEIDVGIFRHAVDLSSLDLSYNQLKSVQVTAAATNLHWLKLDGNELIEVEAFTTSNFPVLWMLSISKNQIPCSVLVQFKRDFYGVDGSLFGQKHGDCTASYRNHYNRYFYEI